MWEQFKTLLLAFLVMSSIIMSSMLLYATPEYAPIQDMIELGQEAGKEKKYDLGQLKKVSSLDFNDQTSRTITIYSNQAAYDEVMTWLSQRQISNLRISDKSLESYLLKIIEIDNDAARSTDNLLAASLRSKDGNLVTISQLNDLDEFQVESKPINNKEDPDQEQDNESEDKNEAGAGEEESEIGGPDQDTDPDPDENQKPTEGQGEEATDPSTPGEGELDPENEPDGEGEDPEKADPEPDENETAGPRDPTDPAGPDEPGEPDERPDPDQPDEPEEPGPASVVYADYLRINLASPLPLAFIDTIIPIVDLNKDQELESYHSFILYKDLNDNKIKALFLADDRKLEAETNINVLNFSNLLLGLRNQQEPARARVIDYQLEAVKLADLRNSLFSNPNAVRQIVERDQSLVYTDGSRGLRVIASKEEMEFTSHQGLGSIENPELTIKDALEAALDFLNKHQSWSGDYMIEGILLEQGELSISFVEDISGHSLYSKQAVEPGKFSLKIKNNKVTRFNSSSKYLKNQVNSQAISILSKDEMRRKLGKDRFNRAEDYRLELAYYSQGTNSEYMKVYPVWLLQEVGGKTRIYDATTGREIE